MCYGDSFPAFTPFPPAVPCNHVHLIMSAQHLFFSLYLLNSFYLKPCLVEELLKLFPFNLIALVQQETPYLQPLVHTTTLILETQCLALNSPHFDLKIEVHHVTNRHVKSLLFTLSHICCVYLKELWLLVILMTSVMSLFH